VKVLTRDVITTAAEIVGAAGKVLTRDVITTAAEIVGAAGIVAGIDLWLGLPAALISGGVFVIAGAFFASGGAE